MARSSTLQHSEWTTICKTSLQQFQVHMQDSDSVRIHATHSHIQPLGGIFTNHLRYIISLHILQTWKEALRFGKYRVTRHYLCDRWIMQLVTMVVPEVRDTLRTPWVFPPLWSWQVGQNVPKLILSDALTVEQTLKETIPCYFIRSFMSKIKRTGSSRIEQKEKSF